MKLLQTFLILLFVYGLSVLLIGSFFSPALYGYSVDQIIEAMYTTGS